jgi:signal transduction histidine kinase
VPRVKNSFSKIQHFFSRKLIFRIGLALCLGYFISQLKLDYIESFLYDLRIRSQPYHSQQNEVVLVIINPKTVESIKGPPKASDHRIALDNLLKLNPRSIVYNLKHEEIVGTYDEKFFWAKLAEGRDNIYFLFNEVQLRGDYSRLVLPEPLNFFRLYSGPLGADKNNFAKDGVTRRMLINYQDQPTLHFHLAQQINAEIKSAADVRGRFEFLGTQQTYINFHPPGFFPRISFEDVMANKINPEELKNKTFIIGLDLGLSQDEYALTPFSRESTGMTTTEVHANMLNTLIRNNSPVRAPFWLNLIFVCVVSILTVHIVLAVKPVAGLILLVSTFFIYTSFSFLLLWIFGLWISLAQPLLAIFLAYYFFIPYRLIIENRRSWEYFQKNKILQEVETLKTNFISMMSHDLKTPIARIQGMLEVLIKEGTQLSNIQREAVDTIKSSSEDLLKFINAILNYAKIESEGVKLHLETKDLNHLLEDVIKKHEFLCKIKKIQIVKELEPLFPIPMDPDLMKQVFSNLIENAIKYSPEETKILITSEESDSNIIVQIADQGQGIHPEDLQNIFMKFFRSRNAKSSPIKGSGLGLYLAKYFVELHKGKIIAESTLGQGSTFTVEVPLSQT